MKTVLEIQAQIERTILQDEQYRIHDLLKGWAEDIIEETSNCDWLNVSWAEEIEIKRELKRKL